MVVFIFEESYDKPTETAVFMVYSAQKQKDNIVGQVDGYEVPY